MKKRGFLSALSARLVLLCLLVLGFMSGCGQVDGGNQEKHTVEQPRTVLRLDAEKNATLLPDGMRDTSFGLLSVFLREASGENVVFSPYSLELSLGLLANGADEATRQDICDLLGAEDVEALNAALSSRMMTGSGRGEGQVQLEVANGIFVAKDHPLQSEYKAMVSDYRPELKAVDFAKQKTVDQINDWVERKTRGQIPKVMDGFKDPNQTRLVAINALYFAGAWQDEFYNLRPDIFHGANGDEETTFMSQHGIGRGYYRDEELQFVSVPFKWGGPHGGCRMFFGLPEEGGPGLTALLEGMTVERLKTMLPGGGDVADWYELQLDAPKFRHEFHAEDLKGCLTALGLNLDIATFNDMVKNLDYPLLLTQISQRAVIEVDEKGVVAAAATVMEAAEASAAVEEDQPEIYRMTLNRPFFYGIVDGQNNVIFLGAMQNAGA